MPLSLFDIPALRTLLQAFRSSMRTLLFDLCDELETQRCKSPFPTGAPPDFFRLVAETIDREHFDHWKVVGWIEGLNDLVYFQDVLRLFIRERDRHGFADQLLEECQEKLYENSYLDDLFPDRKPEGSRLADRLTRLCTRLATELTQESLFLIPGLSCRWLERTGRRRWTLPASLTANFERAEPEGTISIGLDGASVAVPPAVRRAVPPPFNSAQLVVSPSAVHVRIGRVESRICTVDEDVVWDWPVQVTRYVVPPGPVWTRGLTLGPTLVYNRHRVPVEVRPSSDAIVARVRKAIDAIEAAWPAGQSLLATLTSRVIPLHAKGVVSFSYRHRPGISFINVFDRTQLDLIDDLIHENSHHHLNLLLRKYVLYKGDHNQEIFYSPWRRSLRPLRGILHATFTFTMGALLFERLSRWGGLQSALHAWRKVGLTTRDVTRAHFRCLEEISSVRYSLRDLDHAARELGWVPKAGRELVHALDREAARLTIRARGFHRVVSGTSFARDLARHERQLRQARKMYGPHT